MRRFVCMTAMLLLAAAVAQAQWAVEDSHTTADPRGVQAFDSNTAVAMSSGKGDLSRLYK